MAWTKAGREHEKEMEQMWLAADAEKRRDDNAAKAVADKLYYENEEKKHNEEAREEAQRRAIQERIEIAKAKAEVDKARSEAEVRAANYSISEDETEENKFIREELLKKWDNIVQRKNSIDKLKLFEKLGKIKKFIADNFVIELNCEGTKLDDINSLELFYESQNKKLLFVFSEKDSSECRLYLEFKSDENIIKSEISGKCIKQNHSLYDFLCALKHSDLAEDMNIFLSKLSEAEKKLLNKKIEMINEKYVSILNDLGSL